METIYLKVVIACKTLITRNGKSLMTDVVKGGTTVTSGVRITFSHRVMFVWIMIISIYCRYLQSNKMKPLAMTKKDGDVEEKNKCVYLKHC